MLTVCSNLQLDDSIVKLLSTSLESIGHVLCVVTQQSIRIFDSEFKELSNTALNVMISMNFDSSLMS